MKKHLKYFLTENFDVIGLVFPVLSALSWFKFKSNICFILAAIGVILYFILGVPMKKMANRIRKDIKYDEFGRLKGMEDYNDLSRTERKKMAIQSMKDDDRILKKAEIEKLTKPGSEAPDEDLEKLIGMDNVKEQIRIMRARMMFEQEMNPQTKKQKKGRVVYLTNGAMSGRHMVFTGPPGTGKTTVARIITGYLYQFGYIQENKCVEVDGNFLKSPINTGRKTELVIQHSYGGVLFIDEAYILINNGDEAIATLLKQMEDNRDRFILIVAGYTKEMNRFLAMNPGFKSRFQEFIDFPNYSPKELFQIFKSMAATAKPTAYEVDDDVYTPLKTLLIKEARLPSYANARTVRSILDKSIGNHALNWDRGKVERDRLKTISPDDIPVSMQ